MVPTNKTKFLNLFRRLLKVKALEGILISLIKSETRFSHFGTKLVPSHYLYDKGSMRKTKVNGISLILDISDYVNHYVYYNLPDPGHKCLIEMSKDCSVVFDVGANIGFTCLSMSKNLSKLGMVHAFEPDPFNFGRLKQNATLNPNLPISLKNIGMGDKDEVLKLVVDTKDNFGGNRINNTATEDFQPVTITTIDNYCMKNKITNVDLIKIDVEGFEMKVLQGAQELIKNCKPKLFIEVDDNNLKQQGNSAFELITFLDNNYNSLYNASNMNPVVPNDNFVNCHYDLVAHND